MLTRFERIAFPARRFFARCFFARRFFARRLSVRGRRAAFKVAAALACVSVLACGASVAWRVYSGATRAWAAGDVPVAFWTWRTHAPSDEAVAGAMQETRARVLFVRAGQIDYEKGRLRRIRPLEGRFPRALPVHLVYNATRTLLSEFERVGESALAAVVLENFLKDSARAGTDGAIVAGLQLDIDAPTRHLARYARIVRILRAKLPHGAQLSITGLPTWMDSGELARVLDAVDFWIPQFYGAEIPERLSVRAAISSAAAVVSGVRRARALGKSFYAGLPAYSHATLYDANGALVALRGDIDPARIARDPNFELVERRPFDTRANAAPAESEWRYVYRARGESVVEGLSIGAGESLVFNLPGSASLRASVRGVREHAGARLLGICIFRLPDAGDRTTLTLRQIAAALSDTDARPAAELRVERYIDGHPDKRHSINERTGDERAASELSVNRSSDARASSNDGRTQSKHLFVRVTNRGAASALMGDGALQLTLQLPPGSLRAVAGLGGFTSVETLCGEAAAMLTTQTATASDVSDTGDTGAREGLRPCSIRRANVLRLKSPAWQAGASARASISLETNAPATLRAHVRAATDDGGASAHDETLRVEARASSITNERKPDVDHGEER